MRQVAVTPVVPPLVPEVACSIRFGQPVGDRSRDLLAPRDRQHCIDPRDIDIPVANISMEVTVEGVEKRAEPEPCLEPGAEKQASGEIPRSAGERPVVLSNA